MSTPETRVETQVRLILEEQCSKLFRTMMAGLPEDTSATLFFVDYGNSGEPGKNVAFCSTLNRLELVQVVESLVQRWKCGSKGVLLHDRELHGWMPDKATLEGIGDIVKEYVPAGVGFALVFGKQIAGQYLATADRLGMTALFENELLPTWRSEIKQ